MKNFSKRLTAAALSASMIFGYAPLMVHAGTEDTESAKTVYTVEDYNNAQKAVTQAKKDLENGPVLFLDSLVSDESYTVENQIKKISETSDSSIKSSYKKYGSKYLSQITWSNLKRQATLLNRLNKCRANDNNFTDEASTSALKLNPDLIVNAMMSAMISSNEVNHLLFCTSDENLISLGYGENLSWGYNDPLDGWYDAEKKIYDKSGSTSETGHYENCMGEWNTSGTGVVGFGTTNFGKYGGCDALRFSYWYENKAYTADEWLNEINTFKASLEAKVTEAENKASEIKQSFADNGQLISKVTLSTTRCTYDGKTKKPSVKVYNNKGELLTSGYTASVPSGKNLGSYTVKVTGNGNYIGSASATYVISPAKMKKPSVKAGKKKVTVKWKKLGGGSQAYQIAIKKSGSKYKYYTSTGSSKTITKLAKKKKYTVKIRSYKKINGKTYYGSWSSSKTVRVK